MAEMKGLTPVGEQRCENDSVPYSLMRERQCPLLPRKLARSGLKRNAEALLETLRQDPYRSPPPYEGLVGDLTGALSRRINVQHRLVYQVLDEAKTVKILRMWTHCE